MKLSRQFTVFTTKIKLYYNGHRRDEADAKAKSLLPFGDHIGSDIIVKAGKSNS